MDDESKLTNSPPSNMETPPPIQRLPIELLTKIIEKLPRTQWPALELVHPGFFRDATLLAWGSLREVDVERDFICSKVKDSEIRQGRFLQVTVRKTESILKKLNERSPQITSLTGVSFVYDASLNTTAIRYLTAFEHLEMIKFTNSEDALDLIHLIDFIESTQSRATLKEIDTGECDFRPDAIGATFFDRLRAAFANDDPSRQLLRLESVSMDSVHVYSNTIHLFPIRPILNFFDNMDASRMTRLSFGNRLAIEPIVLTGLINGAPQLRHLDFAFMQSCNVRFSTECQGGWLQSHIQLLAALESHQTLTSLGFNTIWEGWTVCACMRFEMAFLKMLIAIGPRLDCFSFNTETFPTDIRMSEVCEIIRTRMSRLKSIKLRVHDPMDLVGIADFKELENIELDLSRVSSSFDMNTVLPTIISKSTRLKRFIASGYYPDQRAVPELCKLNDLVELRVNGESLTAENFVAFSQVFASTLEVLLLGGGIKEGVEPGLVQLIAKANHLRELVVHQNVTDRLLESLAESCPNLERFNTRSTTKITFDSVQTLVDRCPKLIGLMVPNTVACGRQFKDLKIEKYRAALVRRC